MFNFLQNLSKILVICTLIAQGFVHTQIPEHKLTLSANPNASVGDLFISTANGRSEFNFPDRQEFKFWYDRKPLQNYNIFHKTDAGRMPVEGFLRFIKQSPQLFSEKRTQALYKKALNKAIKAQKFYTYTASKKAHFLLLEAKQEVLSHLNQLPLADKHIRTKLEIILSVPEPSIFTKLKEYLWTGKPYLKYDPKHPERVKNAPGSSFFKVLFVLISSIIGAWITDDGRGCGIVGLYAGLCSSIMVLITIGIYRELTSTGTKYELLPEIKPSFEVAINLHEPKIQTAPNLPEPLLDLTTTTSPKNQYTRNNYKKPMKKPVVAIT